MKVYIVQADNREAWEDYRCWIEGVFSSEELAEQYIVKELVRYKADMARIDELDELYCNGQVTEEEKNERRNLKSYWGKADSCPFYWIKAYEMT